MTFSGALEEVYKVIVGKLRFARLGFKEHDGARSSCPLLGHECAD